MKRVVKSKLPACALVLLAAGLGIVFGGDVVVKQGDMDVSGDLEVTGKMYGPSSCLEVGHSLLVDGSFTFDSYGAVTESLFVGEWVDADAYLEHSSFYDTELYGPALDYLADSSTIITLNNQGQKEYNHQADPVFLQRWVEVEDREKYTEVEVWDEERQKIVTERIYETHEELHSSLSMKVAWLRQCVYELKQDNDTLKAELAQMKVKLGIQ